MGDWVTDWCNTPLTGGPRAGPYIRAQEPYCGRNIGDKQWFDKRPNRKHWRVLKKEGGRFLCQFLGWRAKLSDRVIQYKGFSIKRGEDSIEHTDAGSCIDTCRVYYISGEFPEAIGVCKKGDKIKTGPFHSILDAKLYIDHCLGESIGRFYVHLLDQILSKKKKKE